ncbi:cyclic AMP-dependent transcription factor ATF-7 isoform X2 [Hetaerina americana]|uniref:cyclic AMP-dependent transcription factor ATF-7 isoform X2 n=1 Tax=Hetaerina americana TaxID=62018 RepID=UPI003A7F1468
MGENIKPFACSAHGCGMTFTNEDHLTVHKKKHDMSLNLGSGQKTNVFVADQTPTPTRFIRNCEEVGLFQDLQNVNPFEEQFRKAAEAATSGAAMAIREMDPLAGPQPDDMLHTPHIFPLIESVPCSNGTEPGSGQANTKSITKGPEEHMPNGSHGNKSGADKVLTVDLDDGDDVVVLDHLKKAPEGDGKVLENVHMKEKSTDSKSKIPESLKNESIVNVLLRMPDGRLVQLSGLSVDSPPPAETTVGPIPVAINMQPSLASNSAIPTNNINHSPLSTPKQVGEPANGKPQGLSFAKLKLKEALLQSSLNSRAVSRKDDNSSLWTGQRVSPNPVEKNMSVAVALPNSGQLKSKPTKNSISSNQEKSAITKNNQGKKRTHSPVVTDGTDKRLKYLERNRAAASRCREKRKNWIKSLQRKSVNLETSNVSLLAEVATLRAEVAQLRTMLLAHKDCPVTLMMQNQPQLKQSRESLRKQPEGTALVEAIKPLPKKTIICRNTPKLSIPKKPSEHKRNSLGGGASSGQVLVVSSANSLASQQRQIVERPQLLPAIAQTAIGTVLLHSTPESASVGTLHELQKSQHIYLKKKTCQKWQ